MKPLKRLFIAVLLAGSISSLNYATAAGIPNRRAVSSFNRLFPDISQVTWMSNGNISVARFTMDQDPVKASFDGEGNLISTFRSIRVSQLPFNILMKLNTRFKGNTIRYIVECAGEESHFYVITLENKTHWMKIMADGWGELSILEKFKKA